MTKDLQMPLLTKVRTKDLQMLLRIIDDQAYPRGYGPSRWWTLGIGNRRVTKRAIVAYLMNGEGWAT